MHAECKYLCESPNSGLNFRANIQNLAASEIPLPTFVGVSAQNALFHVKQLDEYFELKSNTPLNFA
jgi:hypothetical protein